MEHKEIKIGSTVTALNKTGKYIGEVTNTSPTSYLVKILAVLKHPMQGDLHHPKQVEVAMFHTRRALAYREQVNIPKNLVKPYHDEIPNYVDSLQLAVTTMKNTLSTEENAWNELSLSALRELEEDYFK